MKASIRVSDLSLAQLVQLNQGLGRQIEKLRQDRLYLRAKIQERVLAGESMGSEPDATLLQITDTGEILPGDAVAPGAVIETQRG